MHNGLIVEIPTPLELAKAMLLLPSQFTTARAARTTILRSIYLTALFLCVHIYLQLQDEGLQQRLGLQALHDAVTLMDLQTSSTCFADFYQRTRTGSNSV
eukprot:1590-Heterococcus_DN1.PRE.2